MSSTSCRWRWGLECCCSVASGSGSGGPRPLLQSRPDRRRAPPRRQGTGGVSVQVARILSAYIARQFFTWVAGVFYPIASAMGGRYEKLDNRILRQAGDPMALSRGGLWLRQSDAADGQILMHGEKHTASDLLLLNGVTVFFIDRLMTFTSRIEAKSARLENGFWVLEDGQRFQPDETPERFDLLRLPTKLTTAKIEESLASPDTM